MTGELFNNTLLQFVVAFYMEESFMRSGTPPPMKLFQFLHIDKFNRLGSVEEWLCS